jgi:hypothetical protein
MRVTANLWINNERTWMVTAGIHEDLRLFERDDFVSWMREGVEGVLDVRRQENRIRRLRE